MIRLMLIRLALVALPVVLWLIWARIARRRGRDVGATPWAWLLAAGLVLAGLSLFLSPLFDTAIDPSNTYVPVEVGPDGRIVPGTP